MRPTSCLLASLGSCLLAASVTQAQPYARVADDTLRFREVTRATTTLNTPRGPIEVESSHEATVAVVLLPGDSARAWYEALRLAASDPSGERSPETSEALGRPFALRVDARGRTHTVAAPVFPASFEGITDLRHQFDDFFPRLPAEALRVGLAWSDTVVRRDSTGGRRSHWHTVGDFRVERDTVVDGEPALVVSMRQALRSESEGPVNGGAAHARSVMQGEDAGAFVYAPGRGRWLARWREGLLDGELTLRMAGGTTTMGQEYRYDHRVTAMR